MIELYIITFGLIKSFGTVPVDILGVIASLFFFVSLVSQSNNKSILYVLVIFTNSTYCILMVNLAIILIFIVNNIKKGLINKSFFVVILMLIVLLVQTILNYNSFYDALRWGIISISWCLVFCLPLIKDSSFEKQLPLLFIVMVISNFIYISVFSSNTRLSIFAGSENIALIIFSILSAMLIYLRKWYLLTLLVLFFAMSDSRTLLILPIVFVINYLLIKRRLQVSHFIGIFIFLVPLIMFTLSQPESRAYRVIDNIVSLSESNELSDLEKVDSRGYLIVEGVNKISEKPLLGNGVINPDFFKIYDPSVTMATYHNSVIDILVTYGFIGALVFFYMIFMVIKHIRKYYDDTFAIVLVSCLSLSVIQPYIFNMQVMSLIFSMSLLLKNREE
ncbi:membrane hypothetical protein [Vibrio owensii]|uniref:O-antigen ligase-related domain-containing protein n=1 Tax=Vibrio owensii TaxID=696485 RepID=A0AAU9Q911_9VIBR|nr:membrane hypothetical protein [Vibrio owensii]